MESDDEEPAFSFGLSKRMRLGALAADRSRGAAVGSADVDLLRRLSMAKEGGLVQLQALVAQVVHRRRRAASRQKASLLRALREQSDKALAALEAESARASESLQLDAQRQVEDVCGRLEAAYADLVRTRDEYRARAAQLWSRCEALQAKAAAVKEESALKLAEQGRARESKLAALQSTLAKRRREVDREVQRLQKSANKMPELASMLLPLLS
ncbi:hypothetical protein QBZ16_003385 [Prototheca wickerhamii]|uniref:Uncharacterized protein n=1 Tax=Prototheca wickerhamii TaxID=3111 RepID=A0AAD9IKX6_PROWI|nr:hypothetical protein QBZ16_003385 [Prototheca wickerhamii]